MIGLAATSVRSSRVANLDAGANITGAWKGGKEVILHLTLLSGRSGLAIIDPVEVTAGSIVVVAEATSAVNAHDGIDAIVLASGSFGTGITRIRSAGAIGRNI